jgi:DNA repair protein RecO (recombination protein O)
MAQLSTPAIICAVRHHGEHGAIVRVMTPQNGLTSGYVRGARSRTLRPILLPGNRIAAHFRVRTSEQLAGLEVELAHSMAPLIGEPLPATAIEWVCALTASALPEDNGYPALYSALEGVLNAIEAAPAARGWAVALARYEQLLLLELGFGLDWSSCALTGAQGPLAYVSPKSGAGVSAVGAQGYESKLMRLPAFLQGDGNADWIDILDALAITGHFIERWVLVERRADVLAGRERLLDRLKRAVA